MAADWAKIEAEYITTDTSYRKLAQKYGLNQATIAQKAKADDWVSKRKQQASAAQAKILEKDIHKKVDRANRLKTVADKLLDKVEQLVADDNYLSAAAIKNLSDALKNIREAQMIRTPEDIEEQKARIAKLNREAQGNSTNRDPIKVVIAGSLDEYSN